MERLDDLKQKVKDPKLYRPVILAAAAAVAALYFTSYVVTAALVVGVAVVAFLVNKANMKQVGIELATFSTVLIAVTYGPLVGGLMGLGLVFLQITAGQYTGSYIIWVIPAYGVAGFIAGSFSGAGVFALGFGITVGLQAVFAALTAVTASGNLGRYMPYAVTNVIFNFFAFQYLALVLLPLMT
jgi:hypothetical protein